MEKAMILPAALIMKGILRELRPIWPNWMALELPLRAPNSTKTRQISGLVKKFAVHLGWSNSAEGQ